MVGGLLTLFFRSALRQLAALVDTAVVVVVSGPRSALAHSHVCRVTDLKYQHRLFRRILFYNNTAPEGAKIRRMIVLFSSFAHEV